MLDNLLTILKNNHQTLYKLDEKSITYHDAYNQVITISNYLKQEGTSPVILYGDKSINQFVSILACLNAKRCYIPLDTNTPSQRIAEIIKETKTSLVITDVSMELPDTKCLTAKEIISKQGNDIPAHSSPSIDNHNAYIIFTSGSTGHPKGVPISYDNLNHFIEWITQVEPLKNLHHLKILSQSSFSFDLSVMDIYFSLFTNSTITAVSKETKSNLPELYQTIKKDEINFLILTPTFGKMLLTDEIFNAKEFPHLKYIFFCGEILESETAKKLQERFPNLKIINAYGPTEATCCVSLLEIKRHMLNQKYLPVGQIDTSAVKIDITDEEIILKGPSVFSGYLNNDSPNVYQEKEVNCYKTKDRGEIIDNYLYCYGRMDNQIKYQGYRIELEDIDNNLLKIEGINEAVSIAKYKENSQTVKLIKSYITTSNNLTENTVKQELSKLIPSYMIPKRIIILNKIPVNKNGKYDRKELYNYD